MECIPSWACWPNPDVESFISSSSFSLFPLLKTKYNVTTKTDETLAQSYHLQFASSHYIPQYLPPTCQCTPCPQTTTTSKNQTKPNIRGSLQYSILKISEPTTEQRRTQNPAVDGEWKGEPFSAKSQQSMTQNWKRNRVNFQGWHFVRDPHERSSTDQIRS